MRWPDGRYIQSSIFFSRWLLAPFLLGLLVCLLALMYRFFGDLFALIVQVPQMVWHDVVTSVLNLVDLALTANLIGYHYDYKDLQVTQVRGNVSVTENAASARVNGTLLKLGE